MEENRLELQKLARAVEAKRTQVTTQYASLMAEKRAQEKQHQVREGLLKKEKRELTSVREKWKVSREKEVSLLRRELREARATEQMLSETFQHFYRLQTDLTRDKLALAERALALEAIKQEILNHAESPAAADRELKKMERSWMSELSEDRELLEKQQTRLEREHRRLQELFQTAQARADRARELEQELSLKLAEVEEAQLTQKQKDERQRHEIMILREKEAQARTEARKFQSELERLVNLLLNEGEEDQELRVAA